MEIKKPRVCLVHIPKAAGTSLRRYLEKQYHKDEIVTFYHLGMATDVGTDGLEARRLFCGHLDFATFRRILPEDTQYITVLRHPYERVLSHYYFWRSYKPEFAKTSLPDPVGPKLARQLDLADFLRCEAPIVRNTIFNVQARQLAGAYGTQMKDLDIKKLVSEAERNLTEFAFVGVAEEFERGLEVLSSVFEWEPPAETIRANAFEDLKSRNNAFDPVERDQEITAEVETLLEANTEADRRLHRLARSMFYEKAGW